MRKFLYGSAAAIGALILSQSAWAQADITYEQDIAAVCEVTSLDNTVLIDLASGLAADTVVINCNEPAEVTATAQKGAIRNDAAFAASLTGGVASVAYSLAVEVFDVSSASIGSGGPTAITTAGDDVTVDTGNAVAFALGR